MREMAGVIAGAAAIAAALLFVFRWEITANPGGVYRLDRWIGAVVECHSEMTAARYNRQFAGESVAMGCE